MGSLDVSPELAPRLAGAVAENVSEDRFCIKHAVFAEKNQVHLYTFIHIEHSCTHSVLHVCHACIHEINTG